MDKGQLRELHCLVEHVGPYRSGAAIFRTGQDFRAILAVRSGTVKTRVVDADGRERIHGFYLPGEMIGLNAIHPEIYPCDAIALDTVYLCRFAFPALATFALRMPSVQRELFRRLSKDIGDASLLAAESLAEERLAAFIVGLAERYAARGFSSTQLRLSMPRSDIATYLRLAPETVSRVLRRFRQRGLLSVDGREVEIRNPGDLRALARTVR